MEGIVPVLLPHVLLHPAGAAGLSRRMLSRKHHSVRGHAAVLLIHTDIIVLQALLNPAAAAMLQHILTNCTEDKGCQCLQSGCTET